MSAEDGGPGFTGEGWLTRTEVSQVANPEAPQGGEMSKFLLDWPATLRMHGANNNTAFNYEVSELLYMSLLDLDKVTLDFAPSLATHWWISEDKQTYRFRINPAAKWSDGTPVTADDIVATFEMMMDPSLKDPSSILTFGKLETPVAKSKYIVEVKAKEDNWRNFLYFSQFARPPPPTRSGS